MSKLDFLWPIICLGERDINILVLVPLAEVLADTKVYTDSVLWVLLVRLAVAPGLERLIHGQKFLRGLKPQVFVTEWTLI